MATKTVNIQNNSNNTTNKKDDIYSNDESASNDSSSINDNYDYDLNDENDNDNNINEKSKLDKIEQTTSSESLASDTDKKQIDKQNDKDESNEVSQDEKAVTNETNEVKEEINQQETTELLDKLLNNVNYGVILAFLDKFSSYLTIKEYKFKELESSLINTKISKLLNVFFLFQLKIITI
jgi:hypothetical protein